MTGAIAPSAAPTEPQKPKRAQSAYFLFTTDLREQVTKELKEKSEGKFKFGDVAKEISSRWAALSAEGKKPYEEKAEADKQRHAEEFRAYQEASDPAGTLRKKYAHLVPKPAPAAAALYGQDEAVRGKAEAALKEAGQEASPKQVGAKVKEMWKAAGEEERKPFEEQAAKEKAEFLQKQKEWQATEQFKEIEAAEKLQNERAKAAEAAEKAAKSDKESAKTPSKRPKKGEKVAAKTPSPKTRKQGTRAKAGKEDTSTPAKRAKKGEKLAATTPKGKRTPTKRTPTKRKQAEKDAAPASAAKRGRRAAKAGAGPGMFLDSDVVAEAAKLNLEAALRNLAARPEVVASGKKPTDLLSALQTSGGLVNPARRALLGEA